MKPLKISVMAISLLYLTVTSLFFYSNGLELKTFDKDIVKTVVVGHNDAVDFKTIQAAINSIPFGNKNWIKIFLKNGIYNEKILIPKEKQKIIMQGSDSSKVIIQYNNAGQSSSDGPLIVKAEYFIAINITFKNTYNNKNTTIIPYKEIKVAPSIILKADKAWLYHCNFISIQDTVADLVGRHYFQNCYIEGAIDFIWGKGQSIYQNCIIYVRGMTSNKGEIKIGYITAQGRESEQDTNGFVFNNCVIKGDGKAFLGRAYRRYSRVIFNGTNMSNVIDPHGWYAWNYKGQEDNFTYVEVNCIGEGANKNGRVKWEKNLPTKDVAFFTEPKTFIDEDGWMDTLPSSLFSLYSPSFIF